MPDGNENPCCLSCQWSTSLNPSATNAVFCQRHQIDIHYAAAMFCSELSHDQFSELAVFIQAHGFESGILYEWISGSTDSQGWYSYFPGYVHAAHALATLQEYPSLSPAMILNQVKTNRAQRLSHTGS